MPFSGFGSGGSPDLIQDVYFRIAGAETTPVSATVSLFDNAAWSTGSFAITGRTLALEAPAGGTAAVPYYARRDEAMTSDRLATFCGMCQNTHHRPHLGGCMAEERKGYRGVFIVVAGTIIANLFAIAASVAATTARFPPPFRFIQQHPWWSAFAFTVCGIALGVWAYRRSGHNGEETGEVSIHKSKLIHSAVTVLRGTRTVIRRSKLKDSPVTIVESNPSDTTQKVPEGQQNSGRQ